MWTNYIVSIICFSLCERKGTAEHYCHQLLVAGWVQELITWSSFQWKQNSLDSNNSDFVLLKFFVGKNQSSVFTQNKHKLVLLLRFYSE